MLSYICTDNGITLGLFINLTDNSRSCKVLHIIAERILCLDLFDLLHPFFILLSCDLGIESLENLNSITYYTCINIDILVDLCCIYINVNDLCITRKL